MKTAALFDLDGVIVDTEGQYTVFWESMGEKYFPDMPDFAAQIKGHTLVQILAHYFPDDEATRKKVKAALDDFERKMDFPYVPGATDFIRALKNEGVKVAVVTSSDKEKMHSLYRCHPEFAEQFDHIFTAENARKSKPAPDCYLSAARYFGFDACDCFVFEDSISGLQAGYDSGACVIGLTTTNDAAKINQYCRHVMADFTDFSVQKMFNLKK